MGSKFFPVRADSLSEETLCAGHREPIVTALLIGAKKPEVVILCKATCMEADGGHFDL